MYLKSEIRSPEHKIRVAIIVPRIDQLGPVKVIQNMVNSLSESDELNIKVFYLDKHVDPEVRFDVQAELLNRQSFCFSDYDIIHSNGIRPDLFAFLNRRKIKYHISTIHNFVFEDLTYTYSRIISRIFGNAWLLLWKRADKLVCVSGTLKNYYAKWFPESKLEVIYNGVSEPDKPLGSDYDFIQAIEGFRSKELKVIGSAGILTRRKGTDQLLRLLSEEKKLALVIIGDGKELSNLKSLAGKLKISDRCLFCGFRNNAVNLFCYFDFFIMPSRSEGFGLALTEAVQQKVPVICSDIPVFNELFNNEEVTFFKLDNIASLSDALKIAFETGKKKADLAYTRYLNNYTSILMANNYYQLYKSVIYMHEN